MRQDAFIRFREKRPVHLLQVFQQSPLLACQFRVVNVDDQNAPRSAFRVPHGVDVRVVEGQSLTFGPAVHPVADGEVHVARGHVEAQVDADPGVRGSEVRPDVGAPGDLGEIRHAQRSAQGQLRERPRGRWALRQVLRVRLPVGIERHLPPRALRRQAPRVHVRGRGVRHHGAVLVPDGQPLLRQYPRGGVGRWPHRSAGQERQVKLGPAILRRVPGPAQQLRATPRQARGRGDEA
mmetsp:Transcript_6635/g.19743  ORF Transcript_6635/g.19743 Transcript_6635/m.19743 type:complete len:236 (-) Transcript_6635:43-750(-)